MQQVECFNIRLFAGLESEKIDNLKNFRHIKDIKCLSNWLKIEPDTIVADPFLFVYNDKLYLFYEYKPLYSPAVIKMTSTEDLISWNKPITVLAEKFHLSFPWVFEENGAIYMIPEAAESNSIRLYKATDKTLSSFTFAHKLVDNTIFADNPIYQNCKVSHPFCDSCIYKKGDTYYLWTTISCNGIYHLLLLHSQSLFGPYTIHEKSPISTDMKNARNGGSIFFEDGSLFRVSQDCMNGYGNNVSLYKIEKLTIQEYLETLYAENILPTGTEFYKYGGHQLNICYYKGQKILATDAKTYKSLFLHRIINKVGV